MSSIQPYEMGFDSANLGKMLLLLQKKETSLEAQNRGISGPHNND